MKTYKNLEHLETRLKKGMDWADWIKVEGREYKMVEYGNGYGDNYMLFQNKPTLQIIEVRYQVPTRNKGIETHRYAFHRVEVYKAEELYRYY